MKVTDELCNGICMSAAEIGLPGGSQVAYAHPNCEAHGDGPFEPPTADVVRVEKGEGSE